MISHKVHPHDIGLPEPVVRKRRRSRRVGAIMLSVAVVTAGLGWFLFGTSIFNAVHIKDQSPLLAIGAYAILIVSSVTLVLGFWYLLLAQVERVARMVDASELEEMSLDGEPCPSCRRKAAAEDRFCRHCGASLIEHRG
ncbi:MAG TPA: hypothetical protein VGN88_07960 [Phycisphaerae bacterium]|jgi:Kef-type K+ transport system membrane component KefB